ncbi:MAG: carbohydrate-binding domain-containing protein [Clostridia bacterium]|nr:carbohydrate-binding domain-containing protein [Clostridia bacterium]
MKRMIAMLMALLMLGGCAVKEEAPAASVPTVPVQVQQETAYESRFSTETLIELSDEGIKTKTLSVFASNDIIYYEDRDFYESGNPYGEGEDADKHAAEEAEKHIVVNITEPGAYRVTGKLSAGQIRVDLGEDAYEDPNAVVELILDNADITCTVAPAILFLNVYECDGAWSEDTAKPDVDTSAAGANLILEGKNTVNGSYVARIYKDKEGEKKLWKQDGAIYSYMSMNVSGSGALDLTAENEGMDTELHLTINSGKITIRSGNDGINTNEDNVSVTTINGGDIHIIAGLGAEGDGIDSNGYLVINGGKVFSSAHPAADAGLDSDLGSYIHGGTVLALGSSMDWAESDSDQVTMNLQFAQYQSPADTIVVTREDGTEVFSYDPAADAVVGENARRFMGAIISCPDLKQGDTYLVYTGGQQLQYTGTDVMRRPGGFGGQMPDNAPPEGFDGQMPEMPEGWTPEQMGEPPAEFAGKIPEGFEGQMPPMPDGQGGGGRGEQKGKPEGFNGSGSAEQSGEGNTLFYMQDKVNFFSGLTAASE